MLIIYLGWLAFHNDSEEKYKEKQEYGPTLSFFLDNNSEFNKTSFHKIYILKQADRKSRDIYQYIATTLKREKEIKNGVLKEINDYNGNPTDYNSIQEYLETTFYKIVEENQEVDEIVIHISPGTPVMQTLWCLMTASGIVKSLFSEKRKKPVIRLIKTIRKKDCRDNKITEDVHLKFEGFYNSYKKMMAGNSTPSVKTEDRTYQKIKPESYKSEAMKNLINKIGRIAEVNAPLLILGERGVGKTTFAQWLRNSSSNIPDSKKKTPLLTLSCGVYTSDLLRSELCGYVKGAFTGATKEKKGLFAAADKDILFLDEIGDCSLEMQGVIIRTIEEKKFLPVGAEKDEESSFRLICATNLTYKQLAKKIRADLLDRISLLTVTIPPLRELREDLPMIWEQVWQLESKKGSPNEGKLVLNKSWSDELLQLLVNEKLHGNIRDLQKVVYCILTYWNRAENRPDCTPAQVIDESLHTWKNITTTKKKVSVTFPPDKKIDMKMYEKELNVSFINEVEKRKNRGKELNEITTMELRTYNNWKKKYLN